MSILSDLFGGGKNPADAAMPYLNQIPDVGHNAYDPYISQGQAAGGRAGSAYEDLMKDPTGFINKLMENYQTSAGYGAKKDELTNLMGNTAASGGFAGSPFDQGQQAKGVNDLLSQDMQQYLQNAFGAYKTGLEGEQGIANQGFQASGNLADILGGNLNQQANLGFQGQQQKNSNKTAIISALIKALGIGGGLAAGGGLGGLALGGLGSGMFGGG